MRDTRDKTIRVNYTYLTSHIEKLKIMSEETSIPMSALIRKALNKFFEECGKNDKKQAT